MFKHTKSLLKLKNVNSIQKSYLSLVKEKWDLMTAVCLERSPKITPAPNELENKFQEYLLLVENEKSYKSDHEIRHELELKQEQLLKKGDADLDLSLKETAQDFVDASLDELSKFTPASRSTKSDKANDLTSLDRKLDKHLVLLVNQKIGNKSYYLLPQAIREDGETLRQAAERLLKTTCGPDVKAQFYGNAPSGFYKYKYPKEIREKSNVAGAKVFIYFARHIKGQLPTKGMDFKWLDRTELEKTLPPAYHKSLDQLLISEQ